MRITMALSAAIIAIAPASLFSAPADAYGSDGHRIVCDLAYRYLSDEARGEVDRLVELDEEYSHFRDVCSWADRVRNTTHRFTTPWHYTGQEREDRVVDVEDCAPMGCIISAIELHAEALRSDETSAEERVEALKFYAHWVGDIHQPLHVSINGDRGGNDIDVLWRGERHTNLHRVWDSEILYDYMDETWPFAPEGDRWSYLADELAAEIPLAGSSVVTRVDPIAWAQESHDIARTRGFGYVWARPENPIEPGEAYYQRGLRISRERLKLAAVRLAGSLNLILGPDEGALIAGHGASAAFE
ncbi:MAG: hypothetical protein GYB36_12990 [Alphaproteobacteria bacterium]|nr:hypothetical protein [Alphaproteobacteria bacterium]